MTAVIQATDYPSDAATNALIVTRGLSREHHLGSEVIHALEHIDIEIEQNEFVSIMGPSGSGKTTLMNLLGCLDTPTAGQYWLRRQPVAALDEYSLARIRNHEIGFVFQTFNLLPRASALDNVALPLTYAGVAKKERRPLAEQALVRLGLGDRMKHRPNELSGGQRQRVAIARALVNSPALLLADEPTGNLDSRTSEDILQVLDELHDDGQTILLVTHEASVAAHAGRQIRLLDGCLDYDSAVEARS